MDSNWVKYLIGLNVFTYLLLGGIVYFHIYYLNPKTNNRIDSLEQKVIYLQNKKDSIKDIIDSIDKEIKINSNNYEENLNNVISQSPTDDSVFISDYIRRYIEKNYSNNIR